MKACQRNCVENKGGLTKYWYILYTNIIYRISVYVCACFTRITAPFPHFPRKISQLAQYCDLIISHRSWGYNVCVRGWLLQTPACFFEGHTDTLTKTSILLYKCFGLLLWWSKDIFALSVTLLCQHFLIGIALWDVEALLQHVTHNSISAFKKQHYMKQQTLNEVFKSV